MRYAMMTGRCLNGAERDRGRLIHAIADNSAFGKALCGAQPGRLSNGWDWDEDAPTCPRCVAKLKKLATV